MAVVNSNQEEEEINQGKPASGVTSISNAAGIGGGGNAPGISPGVSGTGVNTATPSPESATPQKTGFTNINDYLTANQGGSNNLGTRATNTITSATQQGTGGIQSAGTNFGAAVNAGTDVYNPSLTKAATDNPTDFLKSPEYDNLVSMLSGTYKGPSDWGTSSQAGNAITAEQQAEQTAQLGQTSGGRQQLLQKTAASPYSSGQGSLNEFLLENNPTLLNPVLDASTKGSNLNGVYQNVAQAGGNQVTAGQNTSTATGNKATGDILGAQTTLQNTLGGQATTAQNTATQDYNNLVKSISGAPGTKQITPVNNSTNKASIQQIGVPTTSPATPPSLSTTQMASLGITPQQWSALTSLNAQAKAAGLPGIDYTTYLTSPNVSTLTPSAEATSKQISDWNALNQLVPGSNQQLLAGANGQPASANPSFNLSDAMGALNAQLQAKQTTPTGVAPTVTPPAGSGVGAGTVAAIAGSSALGSLLGSLGPKIVGGAVKGALAPAASASSDAGAAASAASLAAGGSGIVPTGVPTEVWTDPTTGYTYNLPAGSAGAGSLAGADAAGAADGTSGAAAGVWTDPTTGYTYNLPTADAGGDAAASASGDAASTSGSTLATLGKVAGVVGAVLATYNAVANYQSGDTTGDTLRGAEAGAAIGSIVPGVGTAIGAVVGTVVGAISSLFGSGKVGAATTDWHNVTGANAVSQIANPAASDQAWGEAFKGMLDTGNNIFTGGGSDRHKNPDVLASLIAQQVVSGFKSGTVPMNATSQQVYNSVIVPWMKSAAGAKSGIQWGALSQEPTQQQMIQSVVSRYMSGDAITRGDMASYGNQGTKTPAFKSLVPGYNGTAYTAPVVAPTKTTQPIANRGSAGRR